MRETRRVGYLATADDTLTSAGSYAALHAVIVGTAAASAVVTVYNGDAATDETKAVINAAAVGEWHFDGASFPDGLFVKLTGGNAKVTVVYS